jgi:predicted O-methyltransferase YrrM
VKRRERAGWHAYRALRRLARAGGYHLVRANYYSPIPDPAALPPEVWTEPSPMPGVELDLDVQARFVEEALRPFLEEFAPEPGPPGNEDGFYLQNPFYGRWDAPILHALVRHQRPARVLEVGSGFSTLVVAGALARNARDGVPAEHDVVDPHPSPLLARLGARVRTRALPANEIPLEEFRALAPGDVLFIDTTHTVKVGSDVVYLLLEALPSLGPGVLVHLHDIFRPFEYPRELLDAYGAYWQEHHLLQALLAFNPRLEVVCANHALYRSSRERLTPLLGDPGPVALPSGFWIRTTGSAGSEPAAEGRPPAP